MALNKTPVNINFAKGLNTKTDPNQLALGEFSALNNVIFDKVGRLTKRNGFKNITQLPNATQTTLTTLNNNLIATGSSLYAYSSDTNTWLNRGTVQPVSLNVQPLVRVSTGQTGADAAIASNGLACVVYVDSQGPSPYYIVTDSNTGQQVVGRTALPATATNPRTFVLGKYFVITFIATVGGIAHLQYISVPVASPSQPSAATDISTLVLSLTTGYDAVAANNNLYIAWTSSATTVRVGYLTSTLGLSAAKIITSATADLVSVTADTSAATATVWVSYWDTTSKNIKAAAFNQTLASILAPTTVANADITELTSVANNGVMAFVYEVLNTYAYAPNAKTDYVNVGSITQAGSITSATTILRSVGLASKPFYGADGTIYMLVTYGEANQPTYFLIDSDGNICMRLAYANGGGYQSSMVLPSVSTVNGSYAVPYLYKDSITSVNKTTDAGVPTGAIYSQTGINLAVFSINATAQYSSAIANTLHLTGGQLWMYDGVKPVEHGFHVWPENIAVTTATGSGALTAQQYNYVFVYEWTDNQGNLHRSAPSIPTSITTTTGSSTNTIEVPTLRLTAKRNPNPVRIVGYRWSVAQQTYYQFTSITAPTINDTTVDSVTFTDDLADSSILGNAILYTTGGVIENIAAPASIASALFKNRLFLVDAEDPNLLWYSKQVIQAVPVEMSDLLTLYVAPTSGAQGSTGSITALSALDDKLIIFKRDAIYYLTGTGPDITGASNDFGDPTYITSSVGCPNPSSIVLMPNGIMFQSDKGIWLLGRDMNTTYIGAPVEQYNNYTVKSALSIPGTNQVRFILSNNVTLMYDYYMGQWGTFSNTQAISSTLYQGKDTYLNTYGYIYQETPGTYIDGSQPVLMSFTTSWINVAGVQGYERFYQMLLLGTYYTPFKLSVGIAYDYNPSNNQVTLVTPDNYSPAWGGEANWGSGSTWGGNSNVFEARLFPQQQKCESFQVTVDEVYDSSFGVAAGQGLTLSGLNLTVGVKKGTRTQKASQSFG